MKKNITIYLTAVIITVVLPMVLCAQTDPNNNQPFQDPPTVDNTVLPDSGGPNPPNDAPIDGALTLLLAGGGAYWGKKKRHGMK